MTISQEPEVSDFGKAVGKNVKKESTDELVRLKSHGSDTIVFFAISPLEIDFPVLSCHQAMIGNGDAVSITTEVFKDQRRSSKGRLGVYDPFVFAVSAQELVEDRRVGKRFEFRKEL